MNKKKYFFLFNKIQNKMSSYDLYKYISEYASTGISMALID